jgi:hypothetical protein
MQSEVLTSEEALTGAMNEFVILHKTACTAASKAASTSHCGAAAPHTAGETYCNHCRLLPGREGISYPFEESVRQQRIASLPSARTAF